MQQIVNPVTCLAAPLCGVVLTYSTHLKASAVHCALQSPQQSCIPLAAQRRMVNTIYNEGDTWKRDPCTTCNCIDGFSLCSAISCAPLTCQNNVQHSHRCCPTCIETTVAFPPAPSSDCRVGDIVYRDGESWRPDSTRPCKRAVCDEGEIFFFSHQCAAPECENAIYSEDTCCPICPGK